MPAWKEAQYVIDELSRKIEYAALYPAQVQSAYYYDWGGGLVDIYIPYNQLPVDVEVNGTVLSKAKYVRCLRKAASDPVPSGPDDGVLIGEKEIHSDHVLAFTDREGNITNYKYYLYVKSEQGSFTPDAYLVSIKIQDIVSIDIDDTILDPIKRVGSNATNQYYFLSPPLTSDGSCTADDVLYRKRLLTHCLKNYPAAVNDDGTVRYWLDPKDYKKKIDGTPSDWDNPNFDGNFCAWINHRYFGFLNMPALGKLFRVSMYTKDSARPVTGSSLYDYAFYDWTNTPCQGVWIPMVYEGENDARTLNCKLKIQDTTKNVTETMLSIRQRYLQDAENKMRRVPMADPYLWLLIRGLHTLFARQTNSQNAFGYGFSPNIFYDYEHKKNQVVYDNELLPGFHRSSGDYDYVKTFHSIVFTSHMSPLIDFSTYLMFDSVNHHLRYYPHYVEVRKSNNTGIDTQEIDLLTNGKNLYTSKYTQMNNIQMSEPIQLNSDPVGSSLTGNCDSFNTSSLGTSAIVNAFRCTSPSTDNTSELNQNVKSGMNTLSFIGKNSNPILEYITIPWCVLPPIDYDPFEATGYHPWLNET